MTARLKTSLCFAFPLAALFLCLLFPGACTQGVQTGLELIARTALPALFPALVLSRMLVKLFAGRRGRITLLLPLFMGLLCGFPIGAGVAAALVREGAITPSQGEKMLFFCNNPSPAFLILLCGEKLMGSGGYGWFLWLVQNLFSLLSFLFFFRKEAQNEKAHSPVHSHPPSFSSMLTTSLAEAVSAFLTIGSSILFFSFLRQVLCALFPLSSPWDALLSLFLELTGGIGALSSLPKEIAFPLCAAGAGFGGMAVHFQTLGILEGSGLSCRLYFRGKLFSAALLWISAEILQKCL